MRFSKTLALGATVYILCLLITWAAMSAWPNLVWVRSCVLITCLFIATISLTLAFNRGTSIALLALTFRKAPSGKIVLLAMLSGAAGTLALVSMGGLGSRSASLSALSPFIFLGLMVGATISEEFFVRGWLQGKLQVIESDEVASCNAGIANSIWLSAIFFGLMHLSKLMVGASIAEVSITIGYTGLLGYLCALTRARSESLWACILVHLTGNIGGLIAGGVFTAIAKM